MIINGASAKMTINGVEHFMAGEYECAPVPTFPDDEDYEYFQPKNWTIKVKYRFIPTKRPFAKLEHRMSLTGFLLLSQSFDRRQWRRLKRNYRITADGLSDHICVERKRRKESAN